MVRKLIPPKVVIFLWQASENKIAVMVNLQHHGVTVDAEVVCALCGHEVETIQHLLLACEFSWMLWSRVLHQEGRVWCTPGSVLSLLQEWDELRVGTELVLWRMIPYATGWSIWMERNSLVFKGIVAAVETVWDIHLTKIYWWVQAANS